MAQSNLPQITPDTAAPSPIVTIVVAMARNRVIGVAGGMPWHLPADLKHFKTITMGKPVIMGRRTFESIGKALPGRRNIVISRQAQSTTSVEWVSSISQALALCADDAEVMVIGGGAIYHAMLPLASRLWITEVACEVSGDTWFPEYRRDDWRVLSVTQHPADERHAYAMRFLQLERIRPLSGHHTDASVLPTITTASHDSGAINDSG